ncbi:MAG: amidohydrolase family protein [Verrucomicrobiales bacterium]
MYDQQKENSVIFSDEQVSVRLSGASSRRWGDPFAKVERRPDGESKPWPVDVEGAEGVLALASLREQVAWVGQWHRSRSSSASDAKTSRDSRCEVSRRTFLAAAATSAVASTSGYHTVRANNQVIDCHTHFYDPTRPQGVPWPGKNETQLYRRVLPDEYKSLVAPHGITGTVVVEASEWLEDNQWILDLAKDEPFIKGFVGNLTPGHADFREHVERFSRASHFRGIRVSGGSVTKLTGPAKLRDLHALVDHDLSLDLNGATDSLAAVADVARALPKLRIIIDHVANVRIDGGIPPADWREGIRRASAQPNVFCKVSGLVEGTGKRLSAPRDLNFYRPVLDQVWSCFGEDRVVYGSNWPVSELFADFATMHRIAREYAAEKGEGPSKKLFGENALRFYKWLPS